MAWTASQLVQSPYSNVPTNVRVGYGTVTRNGTSISFPLGISFMQNTPNNRSMNSIMGFYGGVGRYAYTGKSGTVIPSGVWYYANSTSAYTAGTGNTSEVYPWTFTGTAAATATSINVTIGMNNNVYTPTSSSGNLTFSVPIPSATAPSGSVSSSVGVGSATVTGTVSSWGNYGGTGSTKIEWGTSTSYGNTVSGSSWSSSSLGRNTTYYYRFTITNAAGLTASYTGSLRTNGNAPTSSVNSVSPSRTSVSVGWSASYDTNASYSSSTFKYSTTNGSYTTSGSTSNGSASASSLTPNTTYYYQLIVYDNYSRSVTKTGSFTTTGNNPGVSVSSVSPSRTSVSVSWSGSYDTNASYSSATFKYSTTNGSYTTSGSASNGSASASGLAANTTYYFQIVLTDNRGRSGSTTGSFTTTGNAPGLSVTGVTPSRTSVSLTYSASYDTNAGYSSSSFKYGTSNGSYGTTGSSANGSASASGLTPNRIYYYQLIVTDNRGRSTTVTGNFTTTYNAPTATSIARNSSTTTAINLTVTGDIDTAAYNLSISAITLYYRANSTGTYTSVSQTGKTFNLTSLAVDTNYQMYFSITDSGGKTTTMSGTSVFSTLLGNPAISNFTVGVVSPFLVTASATGTISPSRTIQYSWSFDNGATYSAYSTNSSTTYVSLPETTYRVSVRVKAIHTGTNAVDTITTSSVITITTPADQAKGWVRKDGVAKLGKIYVQKNGTPVKVKKIYVFKNGQWVLTKNPQ